MFSKNVSSKDEGTFNISPDFVSTPHQTIPSMCCGSAHVWRPGHCCTTITLDTLWNLAQRSSQYLQSPVTPALYKCALAVVTVAMTAEERFITLLLPPLVTRLQTADCPARPARTTWRGQHGDTHTLTHPTHAQSCRGLAVSYCLLLAARGVRAPPPPHSPLSKLSPAAAAVLGAAGGAALRQVTRPPPAG